MREFAYKPADHEVLLRAIDRLPKDIVASVKNTPHDFYPTFPDNPAFDKLDREMWVEYEVYGQFYGMGVVPCFLYDDIRQRLAHAASKGATGVLLRVEWERVNDWWALETMNALNLIAAAAWARGDELTAVRVCAAWLADKSADGDAQWLADVMLQTWPIIRRALYIDGFLFADSSFLPRSIRRAWWTMEEKHCLSDWDPSRRDALELDRSRVAELLAEKQDAQRRLAALTTQVKAGHGALPTLLQESLLLQMGVFDAYVEGFYQCARMALLHRWMERHPDEVTPHDRAVMEDALTDLGAYRQRIRREAESARFAHVAYLVMDYHRVDDILAEGRALLDVVATPT
ncbi:MAG: hypothetical protein M3Z31_16395 [Pseudomonadota bacterium]|nr:hypothetical protein [Pseudomonadota bacterium]